jgi:putative SOS response-associated peptidase YedK
MCTRVALHEDADIIKQSLLANNGLQIEAWDDSDEFQPKYNIGDKMRAPVVLYRAARRNTLKMGPEKDISAAFLMRSSRWRIVPDFCTVEDESSKNLEVSGENLVNKMGFGKIARTQTRCAVVCRG